MNTQDNLQPRYKLQDRAWEQEIFINWARFQETIKLAPATGEDGRIYDIASGPAHFAQYLVDRGVYQKSQIVCLDLSPVAVAGASKRGYAATVLDIEAKPANQPADVIFFLEALEHTTDPAKVMKNLFDSIKSGGHLVISTPNYARLSQRVKGYRAPKSEDVWQTSGSSRMSIPKLYRLLSDAGFKIETTHHLFQLESLGRVWKKLIKPSSPSLRRRFPHPDYNYVPIAVSASLLADLIMIRARKP